MSTHAVPTSAPVGAASPPARVTLRGLSAAYPRSNGDGPVLAGVDLDLAPGERLAVVGASGSGKSTLLHVLAGLMAPSAGAAEIDGSDAAAGSGRAAYMFQDDLLLPWKTVLGNTVFAASVARAAGDATAVAAGNAMAVTAGNAAGRSGMHARRRARGARDAEARVILDEFGLGDVLDDLPSRLSGGMRQRVALARTLMLGRGLILLDEPFGSLDTLTRVDMQRWVLEVMDAHPATWVLVTHDVREAALLCDQVVVLGGRPARIEHAARVTLTAAERRVVAAAGPHEPLAAGGSRACAEPAATGAAPAQDSPAATLQRIVAELHERLRTASRTGAPT